MSLDTGQTAVGFIKIEQHCNTMKGLNLTKRQKALIAVIGTLEKQEKNTKTFIMKTLFLLRHDFGFGEKMRFYSFFPHKYGPFSGEVYSDLNRLVNIGLLQESQTMLTGEGWRIAKPLSELRQQAELIASKYSKDSIIKDVYGRYPAYTARSELVTKDKPLTEAAVFATGYEGEDIDQFLNKLIENNIDLVIDIRDNPFSMKPSFTKGRLIRHLQNAGIGYTHLKELGVEKEIRKELGVTDDYTAFFDAYKQKLMQSETAISGLLQLAANRRVALLCFENDPKRCHRSILAEELGRRGVRVSLI